MASEVTGMLKRVLNQLELINIISGGSGFINGYSEFPNVDTGLNMRIGNRAGYSFAIDRELTVTGFSGLEDTDWENIGGVV